MANDHVTDKAVASDVAKEISENIVTDKAIETNVSDMPGKADVVADTVNVFDEAVDANKAEGHYEAKGQFMVEGQVETKGQQW